MALASHRACLPCPAPPLSLRKKGAVQVSTQQSLYCTVANTIGLRLLPKCTFTETSKGLIHERMHSPRMPKRQLGALKQPHHLWKERTYCGPFRGWVPILLTSRDGVTRR